MDAGIEVEPGAQGALDQERPAEDLLDASAPALESVFDRLPLIGGSRLPLDPLVFFRQLLRADFHAEPLDENPLLRFLAERFLLEQGPWIDLFEGSSGVEGEGVACPFYGADSLDSIRVGEGGSRRKSQPDGENEAQFLT